MQCFIPVVHMVYYISSINQQNSCKPPNVVFLDQELIPYHYLIVLLVLVLLLVGGDALQKA